MEGERITEEAAGGDIGCFERVKVHERRGGKGERDSSYVWKKRGTGWCVGNRSIGKVDRSGKNARAG